MAISVISLVVHVACQLLSGLGPRASEWHIQCSPKAASTLRCSMAIRVGINGFGRTGRMFYRAAIQKPTSFEIVAVNDVTSAENLSHLLKYDSVYGTLSEQVKVEGSHVMVNGHAFEASPHCRHRIQRDLFLRLFLIPFQLHRQRVEVFEREYKRLCPEDA